MGLLLVDGALVKFDCTTKGKDVFLTRVGSTCSIVAIPSAMLDFSEASCITVSRLWNIILIARCVIGID